MYISAEPDQQVPVAYTLEKTSVSFMEENSKNWI